MNSKAVKKRWLWGCCTFFNQGFPCPNPPRPSTLNFVGTGLGLAISRKFCQLMGGFLYLARTATWFDASSVGV